MIVVLQLEFDNENDYQAFWDTSIQSNEFVVDCEEMGKYKDYYEEDEDDAVYNFSEEVNYADTCRDPDDIHYTDIACFRTLEEASNFVKNYLKEKENVNIENCYDHFGEIKLDENDRWEYTVVRSWGPTYILKKIELQ